MRERIEFVQSIRCIDVLLKTVFTMTDWRICNVTVRNDCITNYILLISLYTLN